MGRHITQIRVVVQGAEESSVLYGVRLSEILFNFQTTSPVILHVTASSTGRLTTLIQYTIEK